MFTSFLTLIVFLRAFGAALPEPLVLLAVGAILIVLPIFARKIGKRAIESPQDFKSRVHETLSK